MARRDGPRQRLGHHQDCLLGCRSASGSDRLFGRRRIWGQAVLCAGWQRVPAEARLLMSAMQRRVAAAQATRDRFRSEEHTSELQSLMRISYAVFCLKKKIYHYNIFYFFLHIYIICSFFVFFLY